MESHIRVAGGLLVLLAVMHAVFPSYFKWKDTLRALPLVSREIMYVHTFFIALTVLLMGVLCLTSNVELVTTHLGRKLCTGLGAFWTIRLLTQFFGYSAELWRGKKFETGVHIVFTALWLYFCTVFWSAASLS